MPCRSGTGSSLWRIDANRVRAEARILPLFGPGVTVGEIAEMAPTAEHNTPTGRAEIDDVIDRLARLSERCRRQSMSMLVPMGQEMAYRYQETLIADLLYALRAYRNRLGRAGGVAAPADASLPPRGSAGAPGERLPGTSGIDAIS